jgi:biotin operon repressor
MPIVVDPKLTPAYIAVYHAIREGIIEHGISPSQSELRRALGCSTTTIINAVRELKKKGHITGEKFVARGIRLVDPERKLSRVPLAPWDEDLDTPNVWASD